LERIYQETGGRGYGGQNGGQNRGGQTGGYPGQTGGQTSSTAGGRYTRTVQLPSQRTRTYSNEGLSMEVPNNWREFQTSDQVTLAPEGAYGDQGITHGVMLGVVKANSN